MNKFGRWLLYLCALPQTLCIGYPIVLALWALRRVHRVRCAPFGVLICTKKSDSATSVTLLSSAIIMAKAEPVHGSTTDFHESRHVAQIQMLGLGSLLTAAWLLLFGWIDVQGVIALWFFGPVILFASSYLAGFLEIGDWYYGSEFERSAYAQAGFDSHGPTFAEAYKKRSKNA
ncbi:MAG: hypothetical protein R3A47_10355 [Polyangiales bacterium]